MGKSKQPHRTLFNHYSDGNYNYQHKWDGFAKFTKLLKTRIYKNDKRGKKKIEENAKEKKSEW